MEEKRNLPSKQSKTEQVQLSTGSQQLKTHLELKNFFEVKRTAITMAPGGSPDFAVIFSEQTTQIATFNRLYGKETTAKLIFLMLEDLNNYFNVARPMTSGQLTDLAIELTEVLWGYRLEEMLAFSEAVKKGTYAKVYERFDPSIVWEQLALYEEARQNHFYHQNTQHKQYDPRIEDEDTSKMAGRLTSMAGAFNAMRDNLKRLK